MSVDTTKIMGRRHQLKGAAVFGVLAADTSGPRRTATP